MKTVRYKYDGSSESLKNHQIDAFLLAESITAFANLITASDRELNGNDADIKVEVKAGFEEGSFGIEFIIDQVANAIEVLPYIAPSVAAGIFATIKKLKGRYAEEIEINEQTGEHFIIIEGEKIPATEEEIKLINSPRVREAINNVVYKPLEKEGIDKFVISGMTEEATLEITKEESKSFRKPRTPKQERRTVVSEAEVEFEQITRTTGSKGWKMVYHGESVPVKISDAAFMDRVNNAKTLNVTANKFKVTLQTTITPDVFTESKEKKSYNIVEVHTKI